MAPFADRNDAGRRLAARLEGHVGADAVVLGLPRGGVVVASQVAASLGLPLDVLLVRKLGVPFHPELAMGAVGEGGVVVVEDQIVRDARIKDSEFARVLAREEERLEALRRALRGDRPMISLAGRCAVIVDDGVATGATAVAACRIARSLGAARLVLAAPVIAPTATARLREEVDELVWLESHEPFHGVGQWYEDFSQTRDDEVARCLAVARRASEPQADVRATRSRLAACDREVTVAIGGVELPGHLTIPRDATGVVLFAHGSGSSRTSPRSLLVAASLHSSGAGTLLFDLLAPFEQRDRANVFNIGLLADRLRGATRWLRAELGRSDTAIGYFGASTGAAAAIVAAADPACRVDAVVSRGGRVDLAGAWLASVTAPTLLIVGGGDHPVLEFNRRALEALRCEKRLEVLPGATHLFGEPGAMVRVAALAGEWFAAHLSTLADVA